MSTLLGALDLDSIEQMWLEVKNHLHSALGSLTSKKL